MNSSDIVTLVASGVGVLAAVVAAWFARRAESSDAKKAVDELAATVEHFTRVARRDQMRRVRAAAGSAPAGDGEVQGPPELRVVAPQSPEDRKQALRARLNSLRGR